MSSAIPEDLETMADVEQMLPVPGVGSRGAAGEGMSFKFDRGTRTATLNLGEAQLCFRCVNGVIEIASDAPIRIRSERLLELAGEEGAMLSSSPTSLEMTPRSMQVQADDLRACAARADFTGTSLNARADHVKVIWGRCERVVGRAFDYARHAYVRVEVLLHTRANRIRTETDGTHLVQAGTARIQARDDVRIQGTSINLG